MFRKTALSVGLLFLLPVFLFAQEGKLRGKITDKESGEPLIGANVVLEGSSLGASSDVNGEYIVLSVPPGVYSVKATYIGYSPVTISNIRVNSSFTTTQDFAMSSTSVQVKAVDIVAERPLIQRNTTNTVRINTQESIRNIPFRGIQNILAVEAGVVQQGGNLYVRGGRAGEVAYYVDGASVTNPFLKNSSDVNANQVVVPIQEAIEELQLQTGGFTAEFGGAASGVVRQSIRTGGADLKATISYQTDDFASPGKQFLSTSSFGYKNAVVTVGGPITPDIRFFVAGQEDYLRQRQQRFVVPFRFDSLATDGLGVRPSGTLLPNGGTVEMKQNYLYNNWTDNLSGQGTLLFDLNPLKLRLTASYSHVKAPTDNNWPEILQNYGTYFNQARTRMDETTSFLGNVRLTHVLSSSTFYEVGVSYQNRFYRRYDQTFGDDWLSYPDSVANYNAGFTGDDVAGQNIAGGGKWVSRYQGPLSYSSIYAFNFLDPNAPSNSYSKNKQTSIGFNVDFTSQVNSRWELKLGGKLETWTIRNFAIGNISAYLTELHGLTGTGNTTYADDYTRRVYLIRRGGINNYGYDVDGNETDGVSYGSVTVDKPGQPVFASAYIQNKFEYKDLIVNFGVRYELMDVKGLALPQADWSQPAIDAAHSALNIVDESQLVNTDAKSFLLPRISFSFPVSDRTVFHAQYGNYAQYPSLNQLYVNNVPLLDRLNASLRQPYYLGGTLPGFTMQPERNTQYEVGIRQLLSENFALDFNGFYKDLRNQLSIRRQYDANGNPIFVAWQNEDFGTVKGMEVTLELRRTNRLQAKLNYTLSDARGTGSTPLSSSNGVTDEATARFPMFINPFDYNQTHRGSVMLDYRFDKGDGGDILEGLGVNAILSFNSGHNYTKIAEPLNLGQSSPWTVGVRALLDSRSRNPVEPINASSTPWFFNVDMSINKVFYLGALNAELYVNILNLLNSQQIVNVFPQTGTAQDDGWLKSPLATQYKAIPNYTAWYTALNLQNRLYYNVATGNDIYGAPRQVRVGVKLEF